VKVPQLLKKASSSVAQVSADPSIRLTLFLLVGVLGLGLLSGLMGYLFGHQSLKGVTQPDMNPFVTGSTGSTGQGQYPHQGTYLLKESDILSKVERETKGISKASEPKKTDKPDDKKKEGEDKSSSSPFPNSAQQVSLPTSLKVQGMNLEIKSLAVEENAIVLDVTMRNEGAQEVQFLYDFLDISDDQSQTLSSEVKGLPAKFPAKSETFNGAIKVLGVTPKSSKWIALTLTDYPDRKIEFKIPKLVLK
jgi:hypothetical protein